METRGRAKPELFLVSFLALYIEVVFIRWIPGHLRILACYTNFVLMASFLGLSVGLLLARSSSSLMRWVPLVVTGLLAFTLVFKASHMRGSSQEIALNEYFCEIQKSFHVPIWLHIPLFFALISFFFVPLGQVMGDRIGRLDRIPAYVVNLTGSIAGIAAFSLFSFRNAPPVVWFTIGFALLLLSLLALIARSRIVKTAAAGGLLETERH